MESTKFHEPVHRGYHDISFYNVSFLDVNVDELTKGRYDAHKGNDCLHFLGAGRSVYRSWVHMINTQLLALADLE